MAILLEQANKRLRPSEGWLVILLLASAVVVLVTAVREVSWVREDYVIIPAATLGLLLGAVLAKRRLHAFWAWLLLFIYAFLVTLVTLAHLLPPLSTIQQGWEPSRQFWLQNGAIFWDRAGSWLIAVSSGGSSRETIIFACFLGILSFLLSAFAAWATLRWQQPLPGLMLMALVMALNGYYGAAEIWWAGLFVGLAALLTAIVNFAHLEQEWGQTHVDYPEEVRMESLGYSTIIALFLLAFAMLLPSFSISRLQDWFASLAPVTEAESTLGQAFAGVDVPRENINVSSPGGVGGSGALPRDYLIGLPPELAETVVMTAVVFVDIQGQEFLAPPEFLQGTHWRALSYDVYTGQGWAISEERLDPTDPFQIIPNPDSADQTSLTQEVSWLSDNRVIRYSIGLPYRFDHATTVSWRGITDLARVRAQQQALHNHYLVNSRLVTATPEQLREARLEDVPAALMSRYTALPDSVPLRVVYLAQDVAADYENPYDQARALEQFLRQYPYSLDVDLPPAKVDPVEYFLFELQQGYCDYYASSMVVMARALGLPARLGIGYLAQPPDESGVQSIRQINGHSWAEVYFAGYGWVEFEPTATFVSPRDTAVTINPDNFAFEAQPPFADTYTPPPIPPAAPVRPFPWLRVGIVGLLAVGLFWLWRRQRRERAARADGVVWSYGRLQDNAQRIGLPVTVSQTPIEFTQALQDRLDLLPQGKWMSRAPITLITRLYNLRRYGGMTTGGHEEAARAWKQLRRPFWRLRFSRKPQIKE